MAFKKRKKVNHLLDHEATGNRITVMGWVRNRRGSKNVSFISLNDGSTIRNIQAVVEAGSVDETVLKKVTVGAALSIEGELVPSKGTEQRVEVIADSLEVLGEADPEEYPIQPKRHTLDFLRENAHLRFRTNTFGAVFRIRHAMTFAIHKFFHDKGFYNLHTPIITASDAEGAGEMFHVTALDLHNPDQLPKTDDGKVDFSQDLFGRETNLTVSGQLEAELGAMALSQVYTFGPTFRAENSNTSRHAAEFWMIEPEIAFADLEDNMDLAEEMLQYLVQYALDYCKDDLEFLHQREQDEEKNKKKEERKEFPLLERLQMVVDNKFERITYTEAIELLQRSKPYKKGKFQYSVEWGVDLQSEHERWLVEKKFKRPVIITDYPRDIKAFYMKVNDDGKTVGAMDVLTPGIGEIVGGSQREEKYDVLLENMRIFNVPEESMWWYLDTRKFGSVPHAGFGLGFERWIMFITGMHNIRDVIPFPRTPDNAEF